MELQFHKKALPGLQLVKREVRNLEQTQELRISDGMPDIGRILGAWGQIVLRGKEWHSGSAQVSGGVQVWVLYIPEEGGGIQSMETWIPFQAKWDIPELDKDGILCADALLRSADARNTSARKIMVRVNVGVMGEMWLPTEAWTCTPAELPDDVQLLQRTYPVCIPREAGEKPFTMEEELTLPANAPKLKKLLRSNLQPELIDRKIMSDKVVFRGVALLHIMYLGEDGNLHTWDFELPFSQYCDLEQSFEQGTARITIALTSLETNMDLEGRLRVKAGLTGQYMICDRMIIEVTEDAYSPHRKVAPLMDTIQLPMVLDIQQQTVNAEQTVPAQGSTVDLTFLPDHPYLMSTGEGMFLPGQFQLLYCDENGQLQTACAHWEGQWPVTADDSVSVMLGVHPSGKNQTAFDGTSMVLNGDMLADSMVLSGRGIALATGLELGEETEPDPNRPSLILRRAGEKTLWELAKQYGSTVAAIQEANALEGDAAADTMLLIPVL